MKEEEERRIAQMSRFEYEKLTSAASLEAESWTDSTLKDVEQMDRMARGQVEPQRSVTGESSGPHSIPYTAKGKNTNRKYLQ